MNSYLLIYWGLSWVKSESLESIPSLRQEWKELSSFSHHHWLVVCIGRKLESGAGAMVLQCGELGIQIAVLTTT